MTLRTAAAQTRAQTRAETRAEPAGVRSTSGKPLTTKGSATRARIVDVAAELVFEHGAQATSVDDVQRRALVSASQLYHYFSGKQDLVRAVIARQTDAVLAAQQPILDDLGSLAALRAWRDLLVDLQKQRQCHGGCPIGSLAGELAETDPVARHDLVTGFARWQAPIRAGLAAMRDRGDLPPDVDPDRLALAVLAALQGGLLLTQTHRTTAPLEAALDTMIEHIAGLAQTPPAQP